MTVDLTEQEWNIVLQMLVSCPFPYAQGAPVIEKLARQAGRWKNEPQPMKGTGNGQMEANGTPLP